MIINNFLVGACFSLYLCFFVVAYVNRSEKAPFREAFAWFGLVSALQCLFELVAHLFPELIVHNQMQISFFVDALGLPFFFLVIECICKQDLEVLPWRTRWLHLLLSEVPLFVIFAIALLTDGFSYVIILSVWLTVYLLVFTVRMVKSLREYNYLLSYATDGNYPSKNWTMWVLGIGITVIVLYSVLYPYFSDLIVENVYLVCNMLLNSVNAYFVWKQRPENAMELANIKTVLQEERDMIKGKIEEMEKQMEVLTEKESKMEALSSEMEQNAEKLKRKASIKEYMDTMRLQYPMFERNMNSLVEGRLTNHDLLLCMLILEGRKVSYIAKMTGVNVKSVEMGRSRLRKKFNLPAEVKLNEFIQKQGSNQV